MLSPLHGDVLSAALSDATLATVALAMVAMLIKPRLFPRQRADLTSALTDTALRLGSAVHCLVDGRGTVRGVTPGAARVLGAAGERAVETGLTLAQLLEPAAPAQLDEWLGQAWLSEEPSVLLLAARKPPGGMCWFEVRCSGRLRVGGADALALEIRDVTTRAVRDRRLALLAGAMRVSADAVFITDERGVIEHVNPAFERLTGYAATEIAGRPASVLGSGRQRREFFADLWATVNAGGTFSGDVVNRRPDGTHYTLQLTVTPLTDADGGRHFAAVGRDSGAAASSGDDADPLAFHDLLTGLPNTRLLRERSQQILALARRRGGLAALVHIDIHHMHSVNERYGRSVGDAILRLVAERLRQSLRDSDTLARAASTEAAFVVLLSDVTDQQALARVVRRLHGMVRQTWRIGEHTVPLDAHIGVALFPSDGSTFEDLFEQTRTALRRAADAEVPFEYVDGALTAAARESLALQDDFDWALHHNQFGLLYQPLSALDADGALRVAGTAVRPFWRHMERGTLSAAQFLPLAERTGKVTAFDRWVLGAAARQVAAWNDAGGAAWAVVDVAPATFFDAELPGFVAARLQEWGLDADRLVIGIREAAAHRDPRGARRALEHLRECGVRVALNRIGRGAASLPNLARIPVDFVTVDREFVAGIGSGGREEALLRGLIDLAHGLGCRVVAEGVTSAEQAEWLLRAHCDLLQNEFSGPPLSAEDAGHLLTAS